MSKSDQEHTTTEPTIVAEEELRIPELLPLLPIRDVVVYPFMIIPLFVGREMSIKAVDQALAGDRMIMLATQHDIGDEDPTPDKIYNVGTVAMIMRMLKLPDGRVKILVQGLVKARIAEFVEFKPFHTVRIERLVEPVAVDNLETEALMRTVREQLAKIAELGKQISPEVMVILENITDPGSMADLIASNLGLKLSEAQMLLEIEDPVRRLTKVNDLLAREHEMLSVQAQIQNAAREEMGKNQKEYYLREQMKAIQQELGDHDGKEELEELRKAIETARMPENVEKEALKQLGRLERMHGDSGEAGVIRTYLDWLIEIPWSKTTRDSLDIIRAKKILDEDHSYLDKVKERILEFLAVRKLNKQMKGPILCFVGPPGVGKTSLGKSIARALNRKFVRISLGGVRDEAEIRGHRRTYLGALPGRIIQGMKQAGTRNPVFMLDELDKLGYDYKGDPSAALLEVLDPQQNNAFSDHYVNLPYDLSNVLFVATANHSDPIPSALFDRMEVINIPGYTEEEKLEIAIRYLVPRQMKDNGLKAKHIVFEEEALKEIIAKYTREAGLRNLEREIGNVCRKVARKIAEGHKRQIRVTPAAVATFLGAAKFLRDDEMDKNEVGVVNGLAWTSVGGEVLHIEATTMAGKGGMALTGQLGDVMKESVQAALAYIRSHGSEFHINPDWFQENEIHVHVPAGAVPKDGPSAGCAMATALISVLTKVPVKKDVAMTGEISLRGKVLPIGGLKEKILAAVRAGMKMVIIPEQNRKDLEDIPKAMQKKVKIVPVKEIDEVLKLALEKFPIPAPKGKAKPATPKVVVRPSKEISA
ncbi:endopeptidase La [Trichlorobacter lovleyi]|uniref:Lon protease n=1 Tax=Trichlorobacter lovleyi (strain ATCC BAA-1151 / DSM 17278 / SZ) TaxID=398767 RepID=LON_TRIL1|nr:endopeptidase La [Trichlorobacter lovleyi]B3E7K2.1 RecName: Full=Lon protease; AltName: Full=ATP-dependent protease La [Trichlorobacter lovleyi SZ]ACD96519.1 ATP-dependent protease La [Trichlorobacter lovleyi SZ]